MANNRCTYQQTYTISVPRKELLEYVILNDELSKKDYRVFLMLLTELDGYSYPRGRVSENPDPHNYKKIDSEKIADELNMKESEVKDCIKKLRKEGIIEKGDTKNMKNGYRFTF
jgi:transcription initiation factor IIE alpha subunit